MSFKDDRIAKVVYSSLLPDNKPLPKGLTINTTLKKCEIIFEIRCKRPLMSLLATIDDILKMAALAEELSELEVNKRENK